MTTEMEIAKAKLGILVERMDEFRLWIEDESTGPFDEGFLEKVYMPLKAQADRWYRYLHPDQFFPYDVEGEE